MRESRFSSHIQGHRISGDSNRDITNKLGYQQLLSLNHDLSRENAQLKNIGSRLGNELKHLHTQFELQPRDENVELYSAINAHPILHRLESTLLPLLDAYELKIQQFQNAFETVNEEFNGLEKRYQEVIQENQQLRALLTDKISQMIELYRCCGSEKLGTDFCQLLIGQMKEKQHLLNEENSKLEKETRKAKAESEKVSRELSDIKRKLQQCTTRRQSLQTQQQQLTKQNKFLKEEILTLQTNNASLQNENQKLACDLERADSANAFHQKQKEGYLKNIQRLKQFLEQKENITTYPSENKSTLNESKSKNIPHAIGEEDHKKLAKLQKQLDQVVKQRNKMKDQLEQARIPLEQANQRITELKKQVSELELARSDSEMSQRKSLKMVQSLKEKCKNDLEKQQRKHEDEMANQQKKHAAEIFAKEKEISDLVDQNTLIKPQLEKLRQLFEKKPLEAKSSLDKDSLRQITKLKEQKKLTEQFCKEKIDIIENEFSIVKKQSEELKEENKRRFDQIRTLKKNLQLANNQHQSVKEQLTMLQDQIKRIRDQYQTSLKDKQRLFDQKLKEIRTVVEESDRRRKQDKADVEKASREHKRVLKQMENAYGERIKELEAELASATSYRRNDR